VPPNVGRAIQRGPVSLQCNAAFYAYPTTSGCYAIQADSDSFSEVIVFPAS
jgi:hypothetical protein